MCSLFLVLAWVDVACGQVNFVAVGLFATRVMVSESADATEWRPAASQPGLDFAYGVEYSPHTGVFVLCGTGGAPLWWSLDGDNWLQVMCCVLLYSGSFAIFCVECPN